jgi:hypothetical protein
MSIIAFDHIPPSYITGLFYRCNPLAVSGLFIIVQDFEYQKVNADDILYKHLV